MRSCFRVTDLARWVLFIVPLLITLPGHAEESADDSGSAPYAPPKATNESLTLLQAVERTLDHDPNLQLRKQDVKIQQGLAQERQGDFDWTFIGELSYQHEERELRDSVKRQEQDRRDDLTILNGESCELAETEGDRAQQIQTALDGEDGATVNFPADPTLEQVINLIAEEIDRAATTAERVALITEWQRILDSELGEALATAEGARQTCNETQATLNRIGAPPEFEDFDSVSLDLRFEKLYRNGVFLAPFVEGAFDSTSWVGKRDGFFTPVLDDNGDQIVDFGVPRQSFTDFGGKNTPDLYTLRVGFEVNLPLLSNRGRAVVAAGEEAAHIDSDATSLLLKHAASESVLMTAMTYWNLLAAQQRIDVLKHSVRLQEQIVEATNILIQNDEIIAAEIARVKASEANARAQLSAAESDRVAARLALVRAMGYDTDRLESTPQAMESFPPAPTRQDLQGLENHGGLVAEAVERRFDVQASRRFAESSQVLARAGGINVKDRLDFFGRLWTTATGENSFSNTIDRWVAPSWNVAFSYQKQIGNNTNEGRLAQSRARARQDQISAFDLERMVRISVVEALSSLAEAIDRLRSSEQAVGYLEQTLADEMELFKERESNLVDTILTEQQQTGARLNLVDSRLTVANLLAQLRFVTGTLVADTVAGPEVTNTAITQLPLDN